MTRVHPLLFDHFSVCVSGRIRGDDGESWAWDLSKTSGDPLLPCKGRLVMPSLSTLLTSGVKFSHEPFCQLERVILPAIMRVNLEHIGYPQAFEGSR